MSTLSSRTIVDAKQDLEKGDAQREEKGEGKKKKKKRRRKKLLLATLSLCVTTRRLKGRLLPGPRETGEKKKK